MDHCSAGSHCQKKKVLVVNNVIRGKVFSSPWTIVGLIKRYKVGPLFWGEEALFADVRAGICQEIATHDFPPFWPWTVEHLIFGVVWCIHVRVEWHPGGLLVCSELLYLFFSSSFLFNKSGAWDIWCPPFSAEHILGCAAGQNDGGLLLWTGGINFLATPRVFGIWWHSESERPKLIFHVRWWESGYFVKFLVAGRKRDKQLTKRCDQFPFFCIQKE
jgi:hypothetical protein